MPALATRCVAPGSPDLNRSAGSSAWSLTKKGFPKPASTIAEIWRGKPWPKKIHLLDNDFFGNPEWRARVQEIIDGKFRVCFSQGINTRLITDESAKAMALMQYRNTKFSERKLYTAWDNIGDEAPFFKGVDCLERAGIPGKHLMVYMLLRNDLQETWDRIWHRFKRMTERGIEPYPMVKDRSRKDLLCFQRWVITGLCSNRLMAGLRGAKPKRKQASDSWRRIFEEAPMTNLSETQIEKAAEAKQNTDRELWRRETNGDYYAPSIHVTATGGDRHRCWRHGLCRNPALLA